MAAVPFDPKSSSDAPSSTRSRLHEISPLAGSPYGESCRRERAVAGRASSLTRPRARLLPPQRRPRPPRRRMWAASARRGARATAARCAPAAGSLTWCRGRTRTRCGRRSACTARTSRCPSRRRKWTWRPHGPGCVPGIRRRTAGGSWRGSAPAARARRGGWSCCASWGCRRCSSLHMSQRIARLTSPVSRARAPMRHCMPARHCRCCRGRVSARCGVARAPMRCLC